MLEPIKSEVKEGDKDDEASDAGHEDFDFAVEVTWIIVLWECLLVMKTLLTQWR